MRPQICWRARLCVLAQWAYGTWQLLAGLWHVRAQPNNIGSDQVIWLPCRGLITLLSNSCWDLRSETNQPAPVAFQSLVILPTFSESVHLAEWFSIFLICRVDPAVNQTPTLWQQGDSSNRCFQITETAHPQDFLTLSLDGDIRH